MITPFPWTDYSRKLRQKIERRYSAGCFTKEDAAARDMRLAVGEEGLLGEGSRVTLYWLVDEEDGVIADAKYQVFGPSALIGAAEAACELLIGKNYDQASRIGGELIDKQLRDRPDDVAIPPSLHSFLNLVIGAVQIAAEQCEGLPLPQAYVAPPAPTDIQGDGYPGFAELKKEQKLTVIQSVIAEDVQPYIELDGGGVEILDLLNDREVIIAYQGACTTCFSATGATLSYIQQVLRAKVSPDLVVVPDL